MNVIDNLKIMLVKCKVFILKSKMGSHKRQIAEYCIKHNLNIDHFIERQGEIEVKTNRALGVYESKIKKIKEGV